MGCGSQQLQNTTATKNNLPSHSLSFEACISSGTKLCGEQFILVYIYILLILGFVLYICNRTIGMTALNLP